MRKLLALTCLSFVFVLGYSQKAEKEDSSKSYEKLISDCKKYEGYYNFFWNEKTGKLYLEIKNLEEEFLYVNSLAAGVGSNDIGLDRGQIGDSRIVKFYRSGPKILMVQPNYRYRAESNNEAERLSVREAFAQSVLWGFKVEAEENGKILVDLSPFLLQDAHGVSSRLKRNKQGSYKLDDSRSALYPPRMKNFPKNSEFEAILTFTGQAEDGYIRSVTPSSDAVTVRMHHSFIELPDNNYQKRKWDPRAGYFGITYSDYATPIDQPLEKKFIDRHRLIKKNPEAARSEAVEPIIYYVDRGAPEPVKSALIEGARWWNQAFEAAGFIDAFQVREMPEGADPLDIRYNVIQWVHRSTRGWSYGATVTDPRTGEIIKGHVSLGSLRVRQDFLIAQGLLSPYEEGRDPDPRMLEMALARLRQLSAHEVGHTIGLAHNFAASTNGRASVMDYPHPLVGLREDGSLDLSAAYDTGIGEWDKVAVRYGYSQFQKGSDEQEALNKILEEASDSGLRFLSDQDARPSGSAHILAHLWDNGENPNDDLKRVSLIRALGLQNFGMNSIPEGSPVFDLERVLVPLYLSHRYQVEAVAKLIAGTDYSYKRKGDAQYAPALVDKKMENEAIELLLGTIDPSFLEIPDHVLALLGAPDLYSGRGREHFPSRTPPMFDWKAAAETAITPTLELMLHPHRLNRLNLHHAQDPSRISLGEYLNQIQSTLKVQKEKSAMQQELNYLTEKLFILECIRSLNHPQLDKQVFAILEESVGNWGTEYQQDYEENKGNSVGAHFRYLHREIQSYLDDPKEYKTPDSMKIPDGSPIGTDCKWTIPE